MYIYTHTYLCLSIYLSVSIYPSIGAPCAVSAPSLQFAPQRGPCAARRRTAASAQCGRRVGCCTRRSP